DPALSWHTLVTLALNRPGTLFVLFEWGGEPLYERGQSTLPQGAHGFPENVPTVPISPSSANVQGARSRAMLLLLRSPNPHSRIPNPASPIPNPQSRIPNPESRIPIKEHRPRAGSYPSNEGEAIMAKVIGLGGIFFKSRDPAALSAWYAKHLGLAAEEWGGV